MAFNLNVLAIVGIVIVLAYLGSKGLSRLGLPQVVGYILVGVFLGSSFLNIIPLSRPVSVLCIRQPQQWIQYQNGYQNTSTQRQASLLRYKGHLPTRATVSVRPSIIIHSGM